MSQNPKMRRFKNRPDVKYALQAGEVNRFIENLYNLYDGHFPQPIEELVFDIITALDDKENGLTRLPKAA